MDESTLKKTTLPAHELWWSVFQACLEEMTRKLPEELAGTIQFEVARSNQQTAYFYLSVANQVFVAGEGVARENSVWVETNETDLWRLMVDELGGDKALRTWGNTMLLQRVLEAMHETTSPTSLLALRAKQ